MPEGGTYAMVAPPKPYCFPPGRYERVSMVAHYLKANNPTAKSLPQTPRTNSQAKVRANAVSGALTGSKVFLAKFSNTCWSLIETNNGVKVGATYEATVEKIAKVDGFISAVGEAADVRKATYHLSEGWFSGITADMFGKMIGPV